MFHQIPFTTPAAPEREAIPRWVEWLTKPLDAADEPIRLTLIEPVRGHRSKTIAAIIYLCFIASTYGYYVDVAVGAVLLAATIILGAWRLRALVNAARDPYWRQFLLAGLAWAGLIGTMTALCIPTGQLGLIALAGPVMAGLANGAALVNAGVPRMARLQVILMVLPYVVLAGMAANAGTTGMVVIPLVFPFWVAGIYSAIDDGHRARASLIRAQRETEHLAHHDALTGLPNRARFMEMLAAECHAAPAGGTRGSYVLYLDLDGFKGVNDTFGHGYGDDLLTAVAERFRKHLRWDDILGRLGGDEFAAILRQVTGDDVRAIGLDLIAVTREPFILRGHERVSVGVSIGGTRLLSPPDVQKTLEAADEMLYAAKRSGKGTICLV